jgi:hypothetical protein
VHLHLVLDGRGAGLYQWVKPRPARDEKPPEKMTGTIRVRPFLSIKVDFFIAAILA